jgi:hypothetical protein
MLIDVRCSGKEYRRTTKQFLFLFFFYFMRPRNTLFDVFNDRFALYMVVRCNFFDQIMQNHPEERVG